MGLSLNGKPESGISNNHSTRNGTTQKARRKISPGFAYAVPAWEKGKKECPKSRAKLSQIARRVSRPAGIACLKDTVLHTMAFGMRVGPSTGPRPPRNVISGFS